MREDQSLVFMNQLREYMKGHALDAFHISGNDPHLSETAAPCFNIKPFLSGFTGSAGELLITSSEAFLWTDGRYFLQVHNQLFSHLTMMGDNPDFPTMVSWMKKNLKGKTLGFESSSVSISFIQSLPTFFEEIGEMINLKPCVGVWDRMWTTRPAQEFGHIRLFPAMGVESSVKIQRIRSLMRGDKAVAHVISSLEDIAWLLNVRGEDLPFTEVFYGYFIIETKGARLFVKESVLKNDVRSVIESAGVEITPYSSFFKSLDRLTGRVWLDAERTCYQVLTSLNEKATPFFKINPSTLMKMKKSSLEIEGFKEAHLKEGIVWMQLWTWLNAQRETKHQLKETDVIKKFREIRSKQSGFVRESFSPIVGWADHGALPHYFVTPESDQAFVGDSLLLIDAGSHYTKGTTDMTRVFALGAVTREMKSDYTSVLKGLIRLSCLQFPSGTCGEHVDVLAREALWKQGLNYTHGTGHGVGSVLNVHEGPCSISGRATGVSLERGVVISNEPGIYREGAYGIRLENLVYVDSAEETSSGKFYQFKTLSLCPFDARLIDRNLLSKEELLWLSDYHALVYDSLSPYVGEEEKSFLAKNKIYFAQLVEGIVLDSILLGFTS